MQQRTRLAARLAGRSAQGWHRPSRCPLWDVADVLTHLVDATGWALGSLAAADTGAAIPAALQGFDPGRTPHEHVLAGRGQSPAVLLVRLHDLTGTLAERLAAIDHPGRPSLRWVGGTNLYSPGLKTLHLRWDSWLTSWTWTRRWPSKGSPPRRRAGWSSTRPRPTGSSWPASWFALGSTPEAQVLLRAEFDELGYDLRLGSVVQVTRAHGEPPPGALVVRGPAVQTVESLAGRGDLAEVAQGPDPAIALSGLGARMRAPIDHAPVG